MENLTTTLILGIIGIISWVWGTLHGYTRRNLGLRGGRPLYAGIGFATLAWIPFLLFRFFLIASKELTTANAGRTFIYLLLFESFCLQLWSYGFSFRILAIWRGALTAVFVSGILFGLMGWSFFGESVLFNGPAALFFVSWGIFYAFIRLRTGSFLGTVIIQTLQTFTVWHILIPKLPPDPTQYNYLYLLMSLVFIILIWRLWPNQEGDYRV